MQKKIVNGVENALSLFVVFMFLPVVYTLKLLTLILKTVKNIFILIDKKNNKF